MHHRMRRRDTTYTEKILSLGLQPTSCTNNIIISKKLHTFHWHISKLEQSTLFIFRRNAKPAIKDIRK